MEWISPKRLPKEKESIIIYRYPDSPQAGFFIYNYDEIGCRKSCPPKASGRRQDPKTCKIHRHIQFFARQIHYIWRAEDLIVWDEIDAWIPVRYMTPPALPPSVKE